jgi:hypothetical protein
LFLAGLFSGYPPPLFFRGQPLGFGQLALFFFRGHPGLFGF